MARVDFSRDSPGPYGLATTQRLFGVAIVIREGKVCAAGNSVRGLKTITCLAGKLGAGLLGPNPGERAFRGSAPRHR